MTKPFTWWGGWLTSIAAVAALAVACAPPRPQACTMIGADDGVAVIVSGTGAAALENTSVTVQSCSSSLGCATKKGDLHQGGVMAPEGCTGASCSPIPLPNTTLTAFIPFQHDDQEPWTVTAWLGDEDATPDVGPVTTAGWIFAPNGSGCEPKVSRADLLVTV